MKKSWKIILIILAVILILGILLIFLRTPAEYHSGSTCPYYTGDCSCLGLKIANPFDMSVGGSSFSYCYGIYLANCKCYKNSCPVSTGYKEEIPCQQLGNILG